MYACMHVFNGTLSDLPSTMDSFFIPLISSLHFFSICLGWYYTTSTPSQHAGVTTTTNNISILIKLIIIIRIVVHLLVLQLYILLSLQHVKVVKQICEYFEITNTYYIDTLMLQLEKKTKKKTSQI